MGIISETKDTYRYAKDELSRDFSRVGWKKKKKVKKKSFGIERGKSIPTSNVIKKIKKTLPKSVYKRGKFKRKNIKKIKKQSFNVDLNLKGLY